MTLHVCVTAQQAIYHFQNKMLYICNVRWTQYMCTYIKTRNVYEIYIEHCLPYHIINIRIEKGENKIWLNQFWLMPCIYSSWVESISDKCVCNYFVYTTSSISKGAKTFMISNSKNIPSLKNYLKWFTFFARKLYPFMVSSEQRSQP